jgi:Mrp family chromosome partitioning ATPase
VGIESRPVERDLLELMVAYGFVPELAVAGGRPAAPTREAPSPARTPGLAPLRLGVVSGGPAAGRTTVVVGLAQAWSRMGRSVLLVDLDPADELARLLLLGSALTVNTGQLLDRAVADEGFAEPSHTVLPGVDIIAAGGLGGDPEALPALLRGRPRALREALEPWLLRYDRVLLDIPSAPDALHAAARAVIDGWLQAVPANAVPARLPPLPGAPRFGVVVTRLDVLAPPEAEALAALLPEGLLDTAIPELPGVRNPWDLVAGAAGQIGDTAFAALAEELDARRGTAPLPLPEEERPTVITPERA